MGVSCCQAVGVTSAEYRQAMDALPYGKRLPGAVYLLDPGDDPGIPPLLRITVAELRKRLGIDPESNLRVFSTKLIKLGLREESIGYDPSNPCTGLATQLE